MRKLLIVCMTMVALLITGCGSSPESVVKDFYKALSSGDMEKLEECTTPQAYPVVIMAATVMSAEQKANLQDGIEVVKVEKTGEHTADVTIKKKFGETLTHRVVELDGKWKVK